MYGMGCACRRALVVKPWRRFLPFIPALTATVCAIACGNATSPSQVPRDYTGTISAQVMLPTITHSVSMCSGNIFGQSDTLHPNLTCLIPRSCMSVSKLQLTFKLTLVADADGTVKGTSAASGSEALGLCFPTASDGVLVEVTFPVTGSVSSVVFGGTTSTIESHGNQTADIKRTFAFAGTLRDRVVTGTLTYNEEFASPSGTSFTTGSGSAAFETTLR